MFAFLYAEPCACKQTSSTKLMLGSPSFKQPYL